MLPPVLENLCYIDDVYGLKNLEAEELTRAENWLKATDCRMAVTLQPSWKTALIPYSADVPVRVGFANRLQALLVNRWVYQRRSISGRHEVDLNLAMLTPLGIHRRKMIPRLKVSATELACARNQAKQLLGGNYTPFVVIHPGSGGSSLGWSKDRFLELTRLLSRDMNVVVSGRDRHEVEHISRSTNALYLLGVI